MVDRRASSKRLESSGYSWREIPKAGLVALASFLATVARLATIVPLSRFLSVSVTHCRWSPRLANRWDTYTSLHARASQRENRSSYIHIDVRTYAGDGPRMRRYESLVRDGNNEWAWRVRTRVTRIPWPVSTPRGSPRIRRVSPLR